MEASDYELEASDYEYDSGDEDIEYGTLELKQDPEAWLIQNPSLAIYVDALILKLADDVEKLSNSFGYLFNIRFLQIERCKTLKYLPHSLTCLPILEELSVENCPVLKELPSSFGQLSSLKWLSLKGCGIKCLPDSLQNLHNWRYLELVNCPNLVKLPCNIGHISYVTLVNCPIESLPGGLSVDTLELEGCRVKCFSSKPRNLKTFQLSKCLCVGDILANSKVFNNLQSLHIHGYEMESLPDAITELCNLENLEFSYCMNLEKLPEKVGWLVNLNSLSLVCCGIKYIPLGLCNLTSLTIYTCPIDYQVFKEFLSGLTKLETLVIDECETLQELSTDLKTLVSLRVLSIRRCINFKFLPSFGALLQLIYLSIEGCLCLSELPGDFDELTNLFSLHIEDTNIQSLPSTLTKLPNLKYLTLPVCFKLETLPNDLNFDLIIISIPDHYRLDTLPTKFSFITHSGEHWLRSKATFSDEANSEPDPEELRQGIISEQTIVKTPPNRTDLLLDGTSEHQNRRHRSLELTKGADSGANDLGIENNEAILLDAYDQDETMNQQTCAVRGETSESEDEGHQPLGLTEGSNSSANDARTERCLAISQDDINNPSRKCKRAQNEQTKSPMDQKDDGVINEATNQQTSCFEGGETSECEGEGYQPLGLTEGSKSSANDVGTKKCEANLRNDNYSSSSRKRKIAQKTSEQNQSPMDKKDQHGKRRKINNEEVLRLRGSGITRRAAAFQLKIPVGTFN